MLVFHSPKPNQGIGWVNMPGNFDRSPSPGAREREGRERERGPGREVWGERCKFKHRADENGIN